jgi:glycogen debranching enzyme
VLKVNQFEPPEALKSPADRVRRAAALAGVVWTAMIANDERGDIDAHRAPSDGYFFEDTRLLSVCRLLLDRRELEHFSSESVDAFATRYRLRAVPDDLGQRAPLVIYRHEVLDIALAQHLLVVNEGDGRITFELTMQLEADFADTFELREVPADRRVLRTALDDGLRFDYRQGEFSRSVTIRSCGDGWRVDGNLLRTTVTLQPRASWRGTVTAAPTGHDDGALDGHGTIERRNRRRSQLKRWSQQLPQLRSSLGELEATYERSQRDLNIMKIPLRDGSGYTFGAGAPQLMALFGRDMAWASLALLGFDDVPAAATLRTLAALQGTAVIDRYDEEPGRIHHELRIGEFSVAGRRPDSPYYGTTDATPLFLILLDEHRRHVGTDHLAAELEPNARAALEWIDRFGDRDGDGYVEYQRRNTDDGLENQCWKDSSDSMLFADGSRAATPLAVCEIQGYVYDAKRRCATLAREVWGDAPLAERLDQQAAQLRQRFNHDFWMPNRNYFALALDAEKRPVDSITSNAGHLLFSGIADQDKADAVAERLMADDMFSGYGIRTMASSEAGYDAISYHNGSIWPHDNAIIAAGLARYGHNHEASRIAHAIIDAAGCYGYRLPEVFAGFDRTTTAYAVEYPDAQVPLAMASSAIFMLLRAITQLKPGWSGTIQIEDPSLGEIQLTRPPQPR